ncbi:MAG: hypothetical protein QOI89_2242 [Solirubrobacteraceae bacterium]|jgi:hypothetical protein|nr:hypothetical protein [Solirubrobacteraceae bacterium]
MSGSESRGSSSRLRRRRSEDVAGGDYPCRVLAAIFARVLSRIVSAITQPLDARRPAAGLRRVLTLLLLISALCLLPLRLSPHSARVVTAIVLAAVALSVLTTAAVFRRLLDRFIEGGQLRLGRYEVEVPSLGREVRLFEGVMALMRRAGLALPALLFFCLWAVVYLFIWSHDPAACPADPAHPCAGAAFLGAGTRPTFGDFLYYSANMAFANPAPDLIANTRAGHTAATVEVLSGVGLVTLYASAFFGLGSVETAATGRESQPAAPQPPSHAGGADLDA